MGVAVGYADHEYAAAGARIASRAADVWHAADLIVKVKEPQAREYGFLRPGLTLFAFLHLAADRALAAELLDQRVTALACETIRLPEDRLPLLEPMSLIAGRLAPQVAAHYLESPQGGRGVLLGGAPGADRARVVVIGAGSAGSAAAEVAHGMGARLTVFDRNPARLSALRTRIPDRLETAPADPDRIAAAVRAADALIAAVLLPGGRAPVVVDQSMVAAMRPGAVIVDLAIDQGGSVATARPTTQSAPTYVAHGVTHYCVTNMPGAVARTATQALTARTLPYLLAVAAGGVAAAAGSLPELLHGLNTVNGRVAHAAVAAALDRPCVDPSAALRDPAGPVSALAPDRSGASS